ncbi:MAG: hypothetical protein QW578_04475 [Thermoplasmatales archaeon]
MSATALRSVESTGDIILFEDVLFCKHIPFNIGAFPSMDTSTMTTRGRVMRNQIPVGNLRRKDHLINI